MVTNDNCHFIYQRLTGDLELGPFHYKSELMDMLVNNKKRFFDFFQIYVLL